MDFLFGLSVMSYVIVSEIPPETPTMSKNSSQSSYQRTPFGQLQLHKSSPHKSKRQWTIVADHSTSIILCLCTRCRLSAPSLTEDSAQAWLDGQDMQDGAVWRLPTISVEYNCGTRQQAKGLARQLLSAWDRLL